MSRLNQRWISGVAALMFAFSGVVGCGGETEGEEPGQQDEQSDDVLSFSADTDVTELSDGEAQTLCNEEVQYTLDYLSDAEIDRINCEYQMRGRAQVEDEDPVEYCQDHFDDCLSEGPETDIFEERDDCSFTQMDRSECQITIGEFEDCLEEQNENFSQSIQEFECEDLGDDANGGDSGSERGPACQHVDQHCPGYDE